MSISVANVTTITSSVYTSAGNTAITFMSLCNYSGGNVTANVHVVPNGSVASNANLVLVNLEITAADTYQFYAGGEKLLFSNGDSIQVQASVNSAVTAVVSSTTF
jgi:hypothetical protein